MKIKWKIMICVLLFITAITIFTNVYYYRTITNLVAGETEAELKNYSSLGLTLLDNYYPGEWRLEGDKLYKGGTLMNGNSKVVDFFAKDTGILATIFAKDTRISTTVKDKSGKRATGTKASNEIISTVLNHHKKYLGTAVVAGNNADTYYVPLYDKSGNVVGMWFVGVYKNVIQSRISRTMSASNIPIAIFLILGLIFSYILGDQISKGIKTIKSNIEQMEKGNFKLNIKLKQNSRRDEIGDITRSFINMRSQICDIINSIKSETENIDTSSQTLAEDADNVHSHAKEISDTTEQLSSGMEETAASSQEMSATAIEIEKEVGNVASKAVNGQNITYEIKNRAENLKEVAINSRKTAAEMYDTANKKLRQSIEKANSIEQIKALSQTIMEITAQTNLLALNASIESARAGEAGKGFAVVANEISQLADNSKKAVSKIDEISNDVASAVLDMIASSNNLLEFVDQKVIKDYDVLVQTGEQYNEDANTVETMVSDIKNSASQLSESIKYIINAIEEVTNATADGSSNSAQIAEKSNLIYKKIDQILAQTNSNKKIADKLKTTVQFFDI